MPFTYDSRTAVVVVDLQDHVADPRGGLHGSGGEPVIQVVGAEIERTVEAMAVVGVALA